jgi:diadenosine tetraphosphate (Ap4A) HIT family hydrolase
MTLKLMWAPWRIGYVTGERSQGCVFCDMIRAAKDERNHVLYRGEHNVVMLKAAGAGIDDPMHLHVVPRWSGDTNFMSAVADTRVAPQGLDDSFRQLQPVMHELAAKILGG